MKSKKSDWVCCAVNPKKVSTAEPTFDRESLWLFSYYIKERYAIHLKKDVYKEDRPWTQDPILKQYKFTNVRREHDPTTRWCINHIINNPHLSYRQKVFNIILYRGYNKIETAELLHMPIPFSDDLDISPYIDRIDSYCHNNPGYSPFTGAFMVSGFTRVLYEKYDSRDPSVVIKWAQELYQDNKFFKDFVRCQNQEKVVNHLSTILGMSTFLSYQIFVDCTYLQDFPFSENEYTLCGPGAKGGVKALFVDTDGMTPEECVFWMRDNWDVMMQHVPEKYRFHPEEEMIDIKPYDRRMNVMSLENCLCEFYKYHKTLHNTGRPRVKYKPRRHTYD